MRAQHIGQLILTGIIEEQTLNAPSFIICHVVWILKYIGFQSTDAKLCWFINSEFYWQESIS